MKNSDDNENGGVIAAFPTIALLPVFLALAWLLVVLNVKYRACVHLENGANLGYEAVFDLSRPFLKPIAVPRLQDGTPIVRDEFWSLKVTDTTIYGLSLATKDGSDFEFAWRLDTGVVFRDENPEMYESLVSEAGVANWDMENGSIGTGVLLDELENALNSRSDHARHRSSYGDHIPNPRQTIQAA